MEFDMKNQAVLSLFHALTDNTNDTFSSVVKQLADKNDYEGIRQLSHIWAKFDTFIEVLDEDYTNGQGSLIFEKSVDTKGSDSITTVDEPEIIEAEIVTKRVPPENERLSREVYSQMKSFIFNYIGKRGGRTSVQDLAYAFHEEFKSHFTDYHYTLVNATTPKWQHKMYDQVKTMRTKGIVAPKTPGQDYDYYLLTPKALKSYNRAAVKIEKQLTLPNIEITG
jgi:hypothetical protein